MTGPTTGDGVTVGGSNVGVEAGRGVAVGLGVGLGVDVGVNGGVGDGVIDGVAVDASVGAAVGVVVDVGLGAKVGVPSSGRGVHPARAVTNKPPRRAIRAGQRQSCAVLCDPIFYPYRFVMILPQR